MRIDSRHLRDDPGSSPALIPDLFEAAFYLGLGQACQRRTRLAIPIASPAAQLLFGGAVHFLRQIPPAVAGANLSSGLSRRGQILLRQVFDPSVLSGRQPRQSFLPFALVETK